MKVKIEGMMCKGCTGRVEKALKGLNLNDVDVNLEKKEASFNGEVSDAVIKETIEDLGFDVVGIEK